MARTARFSNQLSQEVDLTNECQIIPWIAQGQELEIVVGKRIKRKAKDKIYSDF
jgi:hypothetical protein